MCRLRLGLETIVEDLRDKVKADFRHTVDFPETRPSFTGKGQTEKGENQSSPLRH
jgi:hypothetical protein